MISELLVPERVILDLETATREEALGRLINTFRLEKPEPVLTQILDRESLMTTGLGRGFAVPRAPCGELSFPAAALAVLRKGVGYSSLDGAPVKVILLLLFPPDYRAYSSCMGAALGLFSQEMVRTRMPQFNSGRDLIAFIKEKES